MSSNGFAHLQLASPDLKKAVPFYKAMFGWKMEQAPMPGMEYTLFTPDAGFGGGMMQATPDGAPHWMPFVFVPDVPAAVTKAKALGAKVIVDVHEVTGYGWAAIFTDPAGSPIAVFKPHM